MKKLWILIPMLLLFSGCTIEQVDTSSMDTLVQTLIEEPSVKQNISFKGYSYYLPNDLNKVGNDEYNEIIYGNDTDYYLYVDIVSYYNQIDVEYEENNNSYFSKIIEYNEKEGYVEINKEEDIYYIEINYNYSEIEVATKEENLIDVIANSIIILNSVRYNDIIIDTLIGEKAEELETEEYTLSGPEEDKEEFLNYIKEYDSGENIEDDESLISDEEELEIIE